MTTVAFYGSAPNIVFLFYEKRKDDIYQSDDGDRLPALKVLQVMQSIHDLHDIIQLYGLLYIHSSAPQQASSAPLSVSAALLLLQ